VDLEQAEQCSKNTSTGLMRELIAMWYNRQRLAASSANSGRNSTIRTAVLVSIIVFLLILFYVHTLL
jgi:hypothetical protein